MRGNIYTFKYRGDICKVKCLKPFCPASETFMFRCIWRDNSFNVFATGYINAKARAKAIVVDLCKDELRKENKERMSELAQKNRARYGN